MHTLKIKAKKQQLQQNNQNNGKNKQNNYTKQNTETDSDNIPIFKCSIILSLHFTRAQFFANHAHSQRVHLAAARPPSTALYIKERMGYLETTPLFTIFYALAARWTVHAKIDS